MNSQLKAAAIFVLFAAHLVCGQEPTNNFTEPFVRSSLDITTLEFGAGSQEAETPTPTHIWIRVAPTDQNDDIKIVGEYLSTYDHNRCLVEQSQTETVMAVTVTGVNTARCDMRFEVTFGHATPSTAAYSLLALASGSVNVEIMAASVSPGPVRLINLGARTVRFANDAMCFPSAVYAAANEVFLDVREGYYVEAMARSHSKVYNQLTAIRECPADDSDLLCAGPSSRNSIYFNEIADSPSSERDVDARVDLQTGSAVFIGGGELVSREVSTDHTEAASAAEAQFAIDFSRDLVDGESAFAKVGKGFASHLAEGERPDFDYPPRNVDGGAAGGRHRLGAVCAAALALIVLVQ